VAQSGLDATLFVPQFQNHPVTNYTQPNAYFHTSASIVHPSTSHFQAPGQGYYHLASGVYSPRISSFDILPKAQSTMAYRQPLLWKTPIIQQPDGQVEPFDNGIPPTSERHGKCSNFSEVCAIGWKYSSRKFDSVHKAAISPIAKRPRQRFILPKPSQT